MAAKANAQPANDAHNAPDLSSVFGWDAAKGEYTLPKLPYPHDALEPHLDKATMEIHHSKHHQAYVSGLNKALAELKKARDAADFTLVKHWSREIAFHGGGHVNHCLFWATMAPPGPGVGGEPTGDLAAAITRDFGSFDAFSKHFQAAAAAVEGSGWAWLVHDHVARRLMIQQMEKQQNLLVTMVTPLLGCDVWEHAYYLRYQNKRADYVKAWMNVINWPVVEKMYAHIAG
ncbi:MAG: superoxide dismutase [Phycisphaerae bacterium]|nr:superoxide dismutase [Phycisphaerae bacterium]